MIESFILMSTLGILIDMVFILCFIIAAYLLAGIKTAKRCIKFFSALQILPIILGIAIAFKDVLGFELTIISFLISIPFYIFMFILWRFCKKNEQGSPYRLSRTQRNTLDKAMYDYFVKGNRENESTTVDHDKLNLVNHNLFNTVDHDKN